MQKQLKYEVNLEGSSIIKTKDEQFNSFFYSGHPYFLIPDFNSKPEDIWLSFMEYLESLSGEELYDQDGGEVEEYSIIDAETGLTKCKYVALGIQENEDDDLHDYEVDMLGYVVTKEDNTYFIATEVNITKQKS